MISYEPKSSVKIQSAQRYDLFILFFKKTTSNRVSFRQTAYSRGGIVHLWIGTSHPKKLNARKSKYWDDAKHVKNRIKKTVKIITAPNDTKSSVKMQSAQLYDLLCYFFLKTTSNRISSLQTVGGGSFISE